MGLVGDKRCGNCKWFFKQLKNPSECHFNPPRTTPMLLGVSGQPPQPIIHLNVSRDITHEGMEACGHHVPKIRLDA